VGARVDGIAGPWHRNGRHLTRVTPCRHRVERAGRIDGRGECLTETPNTEKSLHRARATTD